MGRFRLAVLMALEFCVTAPSGNAEEQSVASSEKTSVRIYTDPAERRKAGIPTKLTDWLTIAALAEVGTDYVSDFREYDTSPYVQLGLDLTFSDMVTAEILIAYGNFDRFNVDDLFLDVGKINVETDHWYFEAGREYLPFGKFYSNFVIPPMVEFGETRATALNSHYSFDYSDDSYLEPWVSVFASDAKSSGAGGDLLDWGLGVEAGWKEETVTIGAGYLSDLAESFWFDDEFSGVPQERVPGLNAYVRLGMNRLAITFEIVKALYSFAEYDAEGDRPWAWNIEVAHVTWPSLSFAARIEGSEELFVEPERQYGVSATWRVGKYISLAADYLFGTYKSGFVFDDDDNELNSRHWIAAELSLEF